MSVFQKVALAVGAATLGVLLWRMDAQTVGRLVLQVGWGMSLVIAQEAVAHLLNATAWRLAFAPEQASAFPLRELVKLRITGDAINYLTPSATIAGEVTRTAMLGAAHPREVRAASVVVAKCTQTLGQVLFALTGLVVIVPGYLLPTRLLRGVVDAAFVGLVLALVLYAAWPRRRPPAVAAAAAGGMRGIAAALRSFTRRHPGRFVLSVVLFLLAYAWGAFEAYWICRFLGVGVSVGTALTIEVLSVAIDSVFFMVPAKVGTQEGGKTAIFVGLGLPASAGLAFGLVRHIRELVWAGLGLSLYFAHRHAVAARA